MLSMSAVPKLVLLLYSATVAAEATWCVVRSEASEQALLTALNYACGGGADCAPIKSSGLCYLPNTVQAHASYAFNSFYQRRGQDRAACSFRGTATIAATDPSYGSCVYPSSPRSAGGMIPQRGPPISTTTNPSGTTEAPPQQAATNTTPLYLNPGVRPILSNSPKHLNNNNLFSSHFRVAILFMLHMILLRIF